MHSSSVGRRSPARVRWVVVSLFVGRIIIGLLIGLATSVVPDRVSYAEEPLAVQEGSSIQRGISYAAWWSGVYSALGSERALQALQSTGAGWIALIVTGHQDGITSTTIDRTHVSTPTDEDLIHAINLAHSLGLKVMLKPHVDLFNEVAGGDWRGDIGTEFTNEGQWNAWFDAYRGFINHYASLAQAHGVEQFCVGTELLGTTHRAGDWRSVVAGVRAIFDGPIVYAALKDGEEVSITWWDAVDYIGVDGYYSLNADLSAHPTVEQLQAAWEGPRNVMAALAAKYDKLILLTEIGYRSQHGCSNHPWDSWAVSEIDLQEQENAYQAAFLELYDEPWLAGMFWWMWTPDPFDGGSCNESFTPYGKPAESILRQWYGGEPVPDQPTLLPDYDATVDIYDDSLAAGWQNWSWGTINLDLASAGQSSDGATFIAAELEGWGALSFWHAPVDLSAYRWLEFNVRSAAADSPDLVVFATTKDGTEQLHVPVSDCRHIEGGIVDDSWKMVRLGLNDLNDTGQSVTRLTIQNHSDQTTSLDVDNIRFVAAKAPEYIISLPLVCRC